MKDKYILQTSLKFYALSIVFLLLIFWTEYRKNEMDELADYTIVFYLFLFLFIFPLIFVQKIIVEPDRLRLKYFPAIFRNKEYSLLEIESVNVSITHFVSSMQIYFKDGKTKSIMLYTFHSQTTKIFRSSIMTFIQKIKDLEKIKTNQQIDNTRKTQPTTRHKQQ